MACKTTYEFQHNFPKVAEESGFSFNTHRPRVHIDWNKIRLVNIEHLKRDRNFATLEQHINDITECVLESEFDLRILDSGVVKLFQLAQLTVEYQQFCRHYLDRSVMLLRDELASAMQDMERMRKDIRNKDDEIRKLRKKYKHTYRPTLPYGNENIATMILRTLSNKGDVYTPNSTGEGAQVPPYNKCSYCDKVFLNQLYLQSHISRRHVTLKANGIEVKDMIPEKDDIKPQDSKLNDEIVLLKKKIKEMESKLAEKEQFQESPKKETGFVKDIPIDDAITQQSTTSISSGNTQQPRCTEENDAKQQKSEVDQNFLLAKFEEWKKEQRETNQTQMESLRNQLIENLNLIKIKDAQNYTRNDAEIIAQLQTTIKEQTIEIIELRKGLATANSEVNYENKELKKQAEEKESLWVQRANIQRQQYDELMQQLESVRDEARAARLLAEAERARAQQLQEKLKNRNQTIDIATSTDVNQNTDDTESILEAKQPVTKKNLTFSHINRKSLDDLHRKAQALLSVVSTSSSDISKEEYSALENKKHEKCYNEANNRLQHVNTKRKKPKSNIKQNGIVHKQKKKQREVVNEVQNDLLRVQSSLEPQEIKKQKISKHSIENNQKMLMEDTDKRIPSDISKASPTSPAKVVRAKLNEAVNNRLLAIGADPLHNGVQTTAFDKLRAQFQHEQRVKKKTNPSYEKIRNSILSYVDSKVNNETTHFTNTSYQTQSPKIKRQFNFGSVLSNVKHKAMSIMKSTDKINKIERNHLNEEIVKKATLLLKTPPGSVPISPVVQRDNPTDTSMKYADSKITDKLKNQTPARLRAGDNIRSKKIENQEKIQHLSDSDDDNTASGTSLTEDETDTDFKKKSKDVVKVTTSAVAHQSINTKSIENLIKSPVRRPATANGDYNRHIGNNNDISIVRAHSTTKLTENEVIEKNGLDIVETSELKSVEHEAGNLGGDGMKFFSEENIFTRSSPTYTKGVLKNAPSTSSLSKKKVIFDLDANQMKSVSASPSQSLTEKSDLPNEIELATLDEDWDISSIEELPVKINKEKEKKLPHFRNSKIAELTQSIESQLARRGNTKPPGVGAVDTLNIPVSGTVRPPTIGIAVVSGSNTSLASSFLDDTEDDGRVQLEIPNPAKSKKTIEKDASDLDVSDFSIDDIIKKHVSTRTFN